MAKAKSFKIERERIHFTRLVAANPNYFGNLTASKIPTKFKAVKKVLARTTYEEVTCLGLDPKRDRLEATVEIKRPTGYGGDLCAAGSREYVRFYLDYGAGFEDAGLAAFEVHDIPDAEDCAGASEKPLTYAVTIEIDSKRKFCGRPVLPRARAILSWQSPPPENQPGWQPVWGNVIDRHVQIRPAFLQLADVATMLGDKLEQKLELPKEFEPLKEVPLDLPDPPPLFLGELAELYSPGGEPKIEPHRFGAADLQLVAASGGTTFLAQDQIELKIAEWKSVGLDFPSAVDKFLALSVNTRYEELDCLALDLNREQLVATFRIKRPSGYAGNLCRRGSLEYVAFWADWEDECEWTHVGTVAVSVHDIDPLPDGGLHYAAFLPVDLKHLRRPCGNPKIARLRAVLSWNEEPEEDPNWLPRWGNRLDAHVQLPPGPSLKPGEVVPLFHRLGGIRDDDIGNASGETLPTATFDNGSAADGLGRPCPFAARVVITGPPFPGHFYRLQVRRVGEGWTSLVNTIKIEPLNGPKYDKSPSFGDYYSYESLANNPDLVLGWWQSAGDELWEVKLDIFGQPGVVIQRIQLKNSGVEDARINIASSGNCGRFPVGTTLNGAFVARDPYLAGYSLGTAPFAAPAGQLVPTGGNVQTPTAPNLPDAPPPGGAPWTLDTTGMTPCGYVLWLHVSDRAIVNSVPNRHRRSTSVGFCLLD